MPGDDTLKTELDYFESQRASLLPHQQGQFALVADQQLIGTFTTEEEAYEAGLKSVGNRPFLIRQIRSTDPALQAPILFVGLNIGTVA